MEKRITILQINSSTVGSTGRIMFNIAKACRSCGMNVFTASAKHRNETKVTDKNHIYISNILEKKIHLFLSKYTGKNGCYSQIGTWIFLKRVKKIKPDIIHLHNLHNCYINLEMLFKFIEREKISTIWTLHDCWAFTGHCAYFEYNKCDKWKVECSNCTQLDKYPYSLVDKTKDMYNLKKKIFDSRMIKMIITPSMWLENLVKQSFLKKSPVTTVYNGVDLDIFRPKKSNIRDKYGIGNKFMILGVANVWEDRKGFDELVKLSEKIDKESCIVTIGAINNKNINEKIIQIPRTQSQQELVELYSAADVLINPTREDNFPTVNIEALSCGTPVVTYNTGGSPESIDTETGIVVEKEDIDGLYDAIIQIKNKPFNRNDCVKSANKFSLKKQAEEYIKIYKGLQYAIIIK